MYFLKAKFLISLALGIILTLHVAIGQMKAKPAEPPLFLFGIGIANITEKNRPPLFGFQYRHPRGLWLFEPFFGFEYANDGTFYSFAGFGVDLFLKRRFVITPDFSIGAHSPGSHIRLGYDIEFRSGASVAWRFDSGSRLGLSFHHLSNANLGKKNPGSENIVLYYALPLNLF